MTDKTDTPDFSHIPAEQAVEIRRIPSPRLQAKVAREVLAGKLTLSQTRQLVNGMMQLKDFPPTPSVAPGPTFQPQEVVGIEAVGGLSERRGVRRMFADWLRRFSRRRPA